MTSQGPALTLGVLLLFAAACREATGPTPAPDLLFTGSWWDVRPITPAGGGIYITLRAAGGRVTGTGQEYRFCCLYDSFTISGQSSGTLRSFALSFRYSKGPTATYVGRVWNADSLAGTWTDVSSAASHHVAFKRQIEPTCADSAPLLGTYDPAAPGYIVRFRDSVDAAAEGARLAARYGFTTTFVYQYALKGFASADMSAATAAVLRCEPSVASIGYNGIVTVGF